MSGFRSAIEASTPYLLMILSELCLSLYITLLNNVLDPSRGVSATALVLYEHLLSALLLSFLTLLFERGKRKLPSFEILCWAFFVGFLQVPLGQLLLTASLRYVTVSFESVAMNTIPVVVFILAVATGRERFRFWGLNGQAKLWGIVTSAAGSTVMVLLSDPERREFDGMAGAGGRFLGCLLVGLGILANAAAILYVERVAKQYPHNLALSTMMNISGAIQTAIFAAGTERNPSSWRIQRRGSLQLVAILYGGIVVTGLSYWASNWCIHKKGPVFGSAFAPLLILFSLFLEKLISGRAPSLESIVGAVLVVGGLYLLLWAKSRDHKIEPTDKGEHGHSVEHSSDEPLLLSNP